MNCKENFDIYIGDDVSQLLGVEENGIPVDLTSATDIQINFPNDPEAQQPSPIYTASLLQGQISIGSPAVPSLGQFTLNLPNAATQYFLAVQNFDVDIIVISGGKTTTYRIQAGANILQRSTTQYQ